MSNQYGYVPMAKAPLLQQRYTIASPDTWTFERGREQYGGVEEVEFSDAQKSELVALGGAWFASAAAFQVWLQE